MMKYYAPIKMMFQKSIKLHENFSRYIINYEKASYWHSLYNLIDLNIMTR